MKNLAKSKNKFCAREIVQDQLPTWRTLVERNQTLCYSVSDAGNLDDSQFFFEKPLNKMEG